MSEAPAVTRFRKYLQIRSVQPKPDYDGIVAFLKQQASEIGLGFAVTETEPGQPVVVMTWKGKDEVKPTLLLNSHTDVVPVYPETWTHDPFSAFKDKDGNIYARGSQDMKCVGMQYLEAIRILKAKGGYVPTRTIHVSFVPDEEVGGMRGMKPFVQMKEFKDLNVGFALDEGLANPTNAFKVYYGERACWWVKFNIMGKPGHGSQFIEDTAAEKLVKLATWASEFRAAQKAKLDSNPKFRLGDVTSVNMTVVNGGIQPNVVPAEYSVVFDFRITPNVMLKSFLEMVEKWRVEAGNGITVEYLQKFESQCTTSLTADNPWWTTFEKSCKELGMEIECEIFPAATDCRYLREVGIPGLGFSPMNNTPVLLHDHNEFLNEKTYMKGIDIYVKIIDDLANLQ